MLASLLLAASAAALGPSAPAGPDSMLVSTAWLAERLGGPDLVLFEIGPREEYDRGHIPGAQHLELRAVSAPHEMKEGHGHDDGALVLELPSAARLDSVLEARGVSDRSRVVLYPGGDWLTPAARVYLTLAWAGLGGRVSVLDGGLAAWRAERRPVSTEAPVVRPATNALTLTPRADVVVDAGFVRSHLRDPKVALVDARDRGFWLDTLDNHMPRGGHIPGAASIPFTSLTDSAGRLLPLETLRRTFREAGAAPGDLVVTYCHIGQQGSWVWLVARHLGYDARLYDGSFQEWSARAELPVSGARRSAGGS